MFMAAPKEARRGQNILGLEISGGCEVARHGCWELNSGLLKEQLELNF